MKLRRRAGRRLRFAGNISKPYTCHIKSVARMKNFSQDPWNAASERLRLALLAAVLSLTTSLPATAQEPPGDWVPMFNGRDLSGWLPINFGPRTFSVRDGLIVTTGVPTGLMRTKRQYENFEMEVDWQHMKSAGNSGVFLWSNPLPEPGSPFARGFEVQVLDPGFNINGKNQWYTTHGDVFPVHGAKMTPTGRISSTGQRSFPSEDRTKSSPEWNHYHILASNGVIRLSVNGKEVTVGKDCVPRKGFLCLESEGSECHFRNVRIRELPSTNPRPEEVADQDIGFRPLYTGVDLSGWREDPGHKSHWQPKDWILAYDGRSEAADKTLWTAAQYANFELICDWRWVNKPDKAARPVLLPSGEEAKDADGKTRTEEVPDAGDSGIYLRGNIKSQVNIWCWPAGSGEVYGYRTDPNMPPEVRAAVTPKMKADKAIGQWNRFRITMNGDRLTVRLNGQTVIENAQLPGVPATGSIGLQDHGAPIEFANIFVRQLQ
jgi:hypothetical protein